MAWAKSTAELETLQNRIWENYELTVQGAQAYRRDDFDLREAEKEMADIRREIRRLGVVNVAAVEDYANLKERYDGYAVQRDDLVKGQADLLTVIDDLNRKMENRFRREFSKLNEYFGETFAALFGGGNAALVLEDEENVLESGIEIKAQRGKESATAVQHFRAERAPHRRRTFFAMIKLRPSPFCILDEIESALDEANLSAFRRLVSSNMPEDAVLSW